MDAQQMLLAAISGVTTALVWTTRILYAKSTECEKDRTELRVRVTKDAEDIGKLKVMMNCHVENCPYKDVK